MTSAHQAVNDRLRQVVLHHHTVAAAVAESRSVNRLLQPHSKVQQIGQYLYVALRLNITTHHSKRHPQLSILEHHSWYDCVERPFAWLYPAGMLCVQAESSTPIVQYNPRVTCNDPRTERFKQAVDERDRVMILVHNREIRRVATMLEFSRRRRLHGFVRSD